MDKSKQEARVYILASMSDVLAKKHESLATAKEIMDSLKGMFRQPEWSLRHEAIKYIYTKRMKEGTSVREHVLDMMMHSILLRIGRLVKSGLLNQLEDNSLPPCDSCLEEKMILKKISEAQIIIPDDGIEDPLTYKQTMNGVDCDQWIKAMDLEMESMYSNYVWTLVDQPSEVRPIGCKWIYKRKRDQAGKVQTFKARLVMDVKTTFLNDNLEESIYMVQIQKGQEQKNVDEPCVYKRIINSTVAFLVLYGDDILLIGNDVVEIVSRYQSNLGRDHWTAVKNILKYLRRTKDYMLVYGSKDLILTGYTDSDFQTDKDARKSTSGSIFTLNGGAVIWRSIKQSCIANSTMEAEYVATCEAAKEAVWLKKFSTDLEVVPNMHLPITLYCDNSGAVANSREPRSHKRGKHIERKYHLIREIVHRGDVIVTKISFEQNVADPFTKALTAKVFESDLHGLGLRGL
ncbi:retrovirus-related pol polyprotein from transposon tnt 1-94 [Cucumis melo var. makuwa]|uniref:Retrovirus-related pol polyprotein from transposon tnt 1-94 n=1 Tax=Cucumis melo var. makuwa TaxID=1194695 RepID=A0A5A7TKJ0_CUCMM|nr:retrovirus-related pol polyprotein from transposon tnt 1-94 [Cucumis melo var. makuwa]TYK17833.1 retrovirus-related pol polyprotein from transposon tnt 1-94 [Cucumis melo var. makuwa]